MARRLVVAVAGLVCAVGWCLAWAPKAEAGEAGKPQAPYAMELPRGVQVFHRNVDFSGDMRLRAEHWDDADFNRRADDTDGFFQMRTRLRMDLRLAETVRAAVELLDAREWESDRSPRPQQNELDVHQAYVEIDQLLGTPLTLRLGRQEIDLGSRRLVAAPAWQNNIRSFDAARLSYADDAVEVHGLAGSVVVAEEDHLDSNRHGEAFFGVYATLKTFGAHKLDLYALGLVSRNSRLHVTGEDGARGDHERCTLGARLYGNLADRWTYDTEVALQRGHYAHDRIRAWAIHADTAYTLDVPWQPTIQPVFNLASGDKDPHRWPPQHLRSPLRLVPRGLRHH